MWEDQWSPTELLQDVGLQGLLGANSVEAVGCVKEHGPDVYLVRYSGGDENINLQSNPLIWEDGPRQLERLKLRLRDKLSTPGHVHWGTTTDLSLLSARLNIGFLVFSNAVQGAGTHLYSLSTTSADFPYWLCLYCQDNVHFQTLALSFPGSLERHCYFQSSQVPPALVDEYNATHKQCPFGTTQQVAVS